MPMKSEWTWLSRGYAGLTRRTPKMTKASYRPYRSMRVMDGVLPALTTDARLAQRAGARHGAYQLSDRLVVTQGPSRWSHSPCRLSACRGVAGKGLILSMNRTMERWKHARFVLHPWPYRYVTDDGLRGHNAIF